MIQSQRDYTFIEKTIHPFHFHQCATPQDENFSDCATKDYSIPCLLLLLRVKMGKMKQSRTWKLYIHLAMMYKVRMFARELMFATANWNVQMKHINEPKRYKHQFMIMF